MTKINKLGKSTFVIAILSFLLVAVLAFGGTYAYFSDVTGNISDSVTLGTLNVGLNGATADNFLVADYAVPNQYILGTKTEAHKFTLDMTGTNIDTYVRIKFDLKVELPTGAEGAYEEIADWSSFEVTEEEFLEETITSAGWYKHTADGADYYYLASDADNATVLSAANAVDAAKEEISMQIKVAKKVGNGSSDKLMGARITITLAAEAIQADWLGDVETTTFTVANLHTAWPQVINGTYTPGV